MKNCVIYARFSSYGQNEQSIEAQTRICKEFAENKGLTVVGLYSDKAKTGTNDDRPAFQKMIKDATSKSFQYIIVYMFDRFARNRRDSIMYKEMLKEKYGIRVISALEPIADDEGGEFYEMFLEWNAEKYSKRLSKRVRDGLDTSCANGTYCGGQLIYGYKIYNDPIPNKPTKFIKKVIIDEEPAELVKMAFDLYDKGLRKTQIVEEINKKGILYKGKRFSTKQIDKWLINQKYTGEFSFGGRPCNNMYPSIVSKELFERVQKRLAKNRYFLGGVATAREPYILTGKLFCGHCYCDMVSDGGTNGSGVQVHYYTCKNRRIKKTCNKKREEKNKLEECVVAFVIDWLKDEKHVELTVDAVLKYYENKTNIKQIKSIETRIANTKNEISEMTDAFISAKNKILRESIEKKMNEYEILLDDLSYQHAILELERGMKISKKDLTDFINVIIQGDINDKEYQKKIVDNLVYKVFVYDDGHILTFLNLNSGKDIDNISIENIKEALEKSKDFVQTPIPASRQVKPNRTRR